MLTTRRLAAALIALALIAAGCAKDPAASPSDSPGTDGSGPAQLSAEIASYDLIANEPNRVLLGVFSNDGVVSYGSIPVTFAFMGTAQDPEPTPQAPFEATASFIIVPQEVGHDHGTHEHTDEEDEAAANEAPTSQAVVPLTDDDRQAAEDRAPELTEPTEAKGAYQATDVVFDKPGFWQAATTVTFADGTTGSATAAFEVEATPAYPAIGSKAPASNNLVMGDIGGKVTASAVDSRAGETGRVPDPSMHGVTIKDARAAGMPTVVVISTPTYCHSRFCGPITDTVQELQQEYGDKAQFVHLELWNDFQKSAINKAAAEWVYRDKNVTEPWVFLVGGDGKIIDRWANVVDPRELAAQLEQLPSMGV